MSIQEVCRLCLSKSDLLCVFDKRFERRDYLRDVILITTGVEIHSEDVISQKICSKCGQNAVKIFQFRQQSLKNDKYLKAQCRELMKRTDMQNTNTNVTIKLQTINAEEKKQEPSCLPSYKVHPTMTALSRKYPKLQFPSICVLSNVDPLVSIEMDTVENYFKSRNLNLKKYARLALATSDSNNRKIASTITECSEKNTECSLKQRIPDDVVQSSSTAMSETVDDTEVVHKVKPINIKLNQTGYSIVRPSTDNSNNAKVKNVCESTNACKRLTTDSPESQSGISKPKKRRMSDSDISSEPETEKAPSKNPSNKISVLSNIEIRSPSVFKCNICGSVQFSAKHLKKHQLRHSRCKFCKLQFKSVGMKQQHVTYSCLVKEALNNLPAVEVERAELDKNVRIHHQDSSNVSSPLPGLANKNSASISSKAAEEIIEIISDDEDTLTPSTHFHKNPALQTVIRPAVRVNNDTVLESLKAPAADLDTIKELLTVLKNRQSVTDAATQIELPTTESIRFDEENLTTELINLKHLLHSYKIPVEILEGSKKRVSYNYHRPQLKPKILKLWNDLTPTDVAAENNSISNQTASSERVITVTPAAHSKIITNDVDLVIRSKSCDSFNKDQTSSLNIDIVIPESSNGSSLSSSSLQTQSSAVSSTQNEPRIPTPECLSVAAQSPSNAEMQNRRKVIECSQPLEIFPIQPTSPVTDIPNGRHSKSSGTAETTLHIDSDSLEIFPVRTISSTSSERVSSGDNQITLHHNTAVTPTSCAQRIVNSESARNSPVQNKTDVNANRNSSISHSEVMDSTTITRQDSINKAIEFVVNNRSESADTGTINERPLNSVIYSNNNKQPSSHISQARPKSTMIQRNQNVRQILPKATTNYHNLNIPVTTISYVNSQNTYVKKAPIPKIASYPNSTPVNQTPQSYISSHTSNIPYAVNTATTAQTIDINYDAFLQYVPCVQQYVSFQPMPNAPLNSEAHQGQTGRQFTASNTLTNSLENRSILSSPNVSKSLGYFTNEPIVTQYSDASNYVNGRITVSSVNQNFDVSNRQLPNTCTYQPILPASVTPSDKSKHCATGLIRVRNVSEMT